MKKVETDTFKKLLKNTDKKLVIRNQIHGQEYKIIGMNVYNEENDMVLWIEEVSEHEDEEE